MAVPELGMDDFARRFSMRAGSLMWFLGAGASASAGIPTAWNMIWEFKQKLFVSQRRVPLATVADLSNERVRQQLQTHIDSAGNLPKDGDVDEYAAIFEAVFPAEADRRSYLDSKLSGAKPSYGHLALALLMQSGLTKLVWTTNFDTLIADAASKIYDSTGPLSVVDLDAPELAQQLIGDARWPIEVKIHGDFRSRRLKNTDDELRNQDARLRKVLVDSCRRFGLVIAGYSGRDESVMKALEDALDDEGAFPGGLFWLKRGTGDPLPRVMDLMERAQKLSSDAAIVTIENFDEVLRDSLRLVADIDPSALDTFATSQPLCTPPPKSAGSTAWPVVRLNGLPVTPPTVCRRVECDVGGVKDTRTAITDAGVNVISGRRNIGVLCFGGDSDVRKAFEPFSIRTFDLHTIAMGRLRFDSAEQGLLRDGIAAALARERDFDVFRRRGLDLLAPKDVSAPGLAPLGKLVGSLSGVVKGADIPWREGIGVKLEWASNQLWLVIEPSVVFDAFDPEHKALVADFARERSVRRYNRDLNKLLGFWSAYLVGDGEPIRALGISDGVDGVFSLGKTTAYSRRLRV